MSHSDGKGSEEEETSTTILSEEENYNHNEAYPKRRLTQPEFVSTDDDSSALSESATEASSSESGHSSHRGGGRRRGRKKLTIKYTTKTAAEGGDGRRTILAATLKRMVDWIIAKEVRPVKKLITASEQDSTTTITTEQQPQLAASSAVHAFIAGYRQYCTPQDLFTVIEAYYYRPPTKGKTKRKDKRRRALHFLMFWIEDSFTQDFFPPKERKKKRKGSAHLYSSTSAIPTSPKKSEQPPLFKALISFLNVANQKFGEEANRLKLLVLRGAKQKPQRSFNLKHRKKKASKLTGRIDILTLDTRALAEQMTLLESEMFLAIRTTEFLNQSWKTSAKKKTSPHIVTMVDRFNTVSFWVASTIVMCKDLKKRVMILRKFIDLAEICLEIRNFSSLMAILGGLNNSAIQRLKQTWAGLKVMERTTFEALNNMMESKLNYKKYREALTQEEGERLPLVPYLGVYLRDLTFIDEGNPDYFEDLINFQKLVMIGEVMMEVREWQSHGRYDIKRSVELETFLIKLVVLPEDVLYKMSESMEASSDSLRYSSADNISSDV